MFCPRCRKVNRDDAKFCRACGTNFQIIDRSIQNNIKIYLSKVIPRLENEGYNCCEDVTYNDYFFKYVAKRSKFELMYLGYSEIFVVFAEFSSIDIRSLRKFSTNCFEYSKKTRSSPLPVGFFEYISCIPVAIVNYSDRSVFQVVQNKSPPKHIGSVEMPVIYDLNSNKLYYFEKTLVYSGVLFAILRKKIQKLLTP